MEFAFSGLGGDLRLGLRERSLPLGKSRKRTVGLQTCPLFGPAADRILPSAAAFAEADGRPGFDPMSKKGFFRNLVLREAKATGEVMVILVTRGGELPGERAWAERMMSEVPAVRSVWRVENDRDADLVEYGRETLLAGAAGIEEELSGLSFRVGPGSFFQPNPRGAAVFYEKIAARAAETGAKKAVGLFCGAGAIELFLARTVEEVVGIDSEASEYPERRGQRRPQRPWKHHASSPGWWKNRSDGKSSRAPTSSSSTLPGTGFAPTAWRSSRPSARPT